MTGTIKVHNVSLNASEQDISEFFSFSGDIVYVELQRLVPYDLHDIICTKHALFNQECFVVVMSGHSLPTSRLEIIKEQRGLCFLRYWTIGSTIS